MIWKTEDKTLKYRKNESMEYILSDETSLAVFDPKTGDTHFFDETGIDIFNALDEPCCIDTLLERLCLIYDAAPDDIRGDVLEFLADCIAKQVIEVI